MSSVEAVIYFENDVVAGCGFPKTAGVKSLLAKYKEELKKTAGQNPGVPLRSIFPEMEKAAKTDPVLDMFCGMIKERFPDIDKYHITLA